MLMMKSYHVVFTFSETRGLKSDLLKMQHKQTEVETDILELKTNLTGANTYHIQNPMVECLNLNFV